MAAFGDHNYGTPFGALSASAFFDTQGSGFYDYSGFSSRAGLFGFSGTVGVSGYSGFCGYDGIEFLPFRPTLTYPLNFEMLNGPITITWKEAAPPDPCDPNVAYELQFTRSLSLDSGWKTVAADIPAGTSSYDFDLTNISYTDDGGFRIRARDSRFLFSDWSRSNEAFTVANHAPNSVAILGPTAHDVFDYCVGVVWKEPTILDIDGHGVSYQIEITDQYSADDGWIVVPSAESIPQGTTSFNITSFDFPEGDDYGIRISSIDELGLASVPVKVGPFTIRHQGSFIVDTLPPEGSIAINDGEALAANTRVKLTLFAFDEATGVKDVRFRNAEEDCWSDFDVYVPEKFWDLPKTDGVKRVFVQFRDYADNISEVCDCEIVSRVLCDEGNAVDIEVFNNRLYVAFDARGNLVEYRVLVRTAAELPEPELSALARFNNYLYISTFDETDGARVYRYDGRATFSFAIAGAKILSMQTYNDVLYLSLDDGRIMSHNGTTTSTVHSATSAVTRLRTDGAVLYATVLGGGEYLSTINGTTWKVNLL